MLDESSKGRKSYRRRALGTADVAHLPALLGGFRLRLAALLDDLLQRQPSTSS